MSGPADGPPSSTAARGRGQVEFRVGADPCIGPRLPSLLAAGCDDVATQVVHPAGFEPDVRTMAPLTAEGIAARVEAVVMSPPRIVQAWGRRPA